MLALRCQRWVQPYLHPDTSRLHDPVVIQPQYFHGSATIGRQAEDCPSVFAPGKMLPPLLLTRVKKRAYLSVVGIWSLCSRPFEFVAAITSKAKIVDRRRAIGDKRNDVFNDHWDADGHRTTAVSTTLSVQFCDLSTDSRRDPRTPGHRL